MFLSSTASAAWLKKSRLSPSLKPLSMTVCILMNEIPFSANRAKDGAIALADIPKVEA